MRSRIKNTILDQFTNGIFKPYFVKFIELKRGKGEKVTDSTLYVIKTINNGLSIFNSPVITKEMADVVLVRKKEHDGKLNANLISTFRQFSLFMAMFFPETYVIPPKYLRVQRKQFHSFIFTDEELRKLTNAADNFATNSSRLKRCLSILPHPFIVRMLIGTGMRIGEILALNVEDIDTEKRVVRVVNGKNGVSRFIPISGSLTIEMRYYLSHIPRSGSEPLFMSPYTNKHYSYDAMRYFIQETFKEAGIKPRNGEKPKIHSFRHTFCTKSIGRMMSSGMNFYSALPILSAYMGHVNTFDTEKYIKFTETSFEGVLNQETLLAELIPEVNDED
jgi:integrase/recombinase XerD